MVTFICCLSCLQRLPLCEKGPPRATPPSALAPPHLTRHHKHLFLNHCRRLDKQQWHPRNPAGLPMVAPGHLVPALILLCKSVCIRAPSQKRCHPPPSCHTHTWISRKLILQPFFSCTHVRCPMYICSQVPIVLLHLRKSNMAYCAESEQGKARHIKLCQTRKANRAKSRLMRSPQIPLGSFLCWQNLLLPGVLRPASPKSLVCLLWSSSAPPPPNLSPSPLACLCLPTCVFRVIFPCFLSVTKPSGNLFGPDPSLCSPNNIQLLGPIPFISHIQVSSIDSICARLSLPGFIYLSY